MAKTYCKDIKAGSNIELNPIYVLVRSKYENVLNTKEKKDIVSDEEALEYADKNNLIFFTLRLMKNMKQESMNYLNLF